MRDIKFRAWDNKAKEWLLGYEYPNLGGFSMDGETMLFNEWSEIINRFILQQRDRKPEDLKLMQFTGLKDTKGKEIYEGDILKSPGNMSYKFGQYGVVEYVEDCGGYRVRGKYSKNQHHELLTCDVAIYCEIIGNIYENPELPPNEPEDKRSVARKDAQSDSAG